MGAGSGAPGVAPASGIARIGVVAALDWEAGVFSAGRSATPELLIECAGAGPTAAAAGARRALDRGARALISWGSAGALQNAEPGAIVLPPGVIDEQQHRFATDTGISDLLAGALGDVATLHRIDLISTDSPVMTPAAKRRLAEASRALAVDMESAAIAAVAARAGVPLAIVRVIVDGPDHCVPACAIAGMDGASTRPGRVLAALLKSPRELPDQLALALAARRARRTLSACAGRLPSALAAAFIPPESDRASG